jgi:hypothetical protein
MTFYRYIYFRIYRFFENLNSRNAHNMALGILTLPIGLVIYKCHLLLMRYMQGKELVYDEIAIPYLVIFLAIYAANNFLLQRDSKYDETEGFFERKEQPKSYDFLLIGLVAVIILIFVI